MIILQARKCGSLPCNFNSPFGLLRNLTEFSITALNEFFITVLFIEDIRNFWWLKSMQGLVRKSPLSFPILFTIVFLDGEDSMSQH